MKEVFLNSIRREPVRNIINSVSPYCNAAAVIPAGCTEAYVFTSSDIDPKVNDLDLVNQLISKLKVAAQPPGIVMDGLCFVVSKATPVPVVYLVDDSVNMVSVILFSESDINTFVNTICG